ncbi:MAG: hypothetical protein HC840_00545 [Leptolyngbyaceae cyanobacterium RM2_2_4]|nr:hypothetical protein [Leptolyngbyaceae cyanobacterium RM2_2_4]
MSDKRIFSDFDSDLSHSIEELNKALEASNQTPPTQGTVSQVNDLSELAAKYLTPSAKYDQAQKATTLTVKYDDGRFYTAIYFATRVATGDEERAVEYLARILNDLSQKGLVHSTLAPISSLELARTSSVAQSVVFSFVLIPQECHRDVKAMYPKFSIEEGGAAEELYDLSVPLDQGEFLANIRISHVATLHGSTHNPQEMFQNELQQYLAVLPKGTRVRKITQLAITDLSVPFEVKFYNPILQRVKRVELSHVRACAVIGDHLEQFNLLTGVRYFDAEDKELYR